MTLMILIALMMSAFREARSDESLMISLLVLIHRSAWKGVSANFAFTEFSEVRELGILRSSGHHIDIQRTGLPWCRDPSPGKVGYS
jgi:hypothetical protein